MPAEKQAMRFTARLVHDFDFVLVKIICPEKAGQKFVANICLQRLQIRFTPLCGKMSPRTFSAQLNHHSLTRGFHF
jgi:hypothetical protein